MSYDIDLLDPDSKEVLSVSDKHHMAGGTYQLGGSNEMSLNVTYNYGKFYYKTMDTEEGIRVLYGKTGAESIPILQSAIGKLKRDVTDNYWDATEGNARVALINLLTMANLFTEGIWQGD